MQMQVDIRCRLIGIAEGRVVLVAAVEDSLAVGRLAGQQGMTGDILM
jgi:hypothetical protein